MLACCAFTWLHRLHQDQGCFGCFFGCFFDFLRGVVAAPFVQRSMCGASHRASLGFEPGVKRLSRSSCSNVCAAGVRSGGSLLASQLLSDAASEADCSALVDTESPGVVCVWMGGKEGRLGVRCTGRGRIASFIPWCEFSARPAWQLLAAFFRPPRGCQPSSPRP